MCFFLIVFVEGDMKIYKKIFLLTNNIAEIHSIRACSFREVRGVKYNIITKQARRLGI